MIICSAIRTFYNNFIHNYQLYFYKDTDIIPIFAKSYRTNF